MVIDGDNDVDGDVDETVECGGRNLEAWSDWFVHGDALFGE